jgi:hypothetical protein
MYFLEIIREVLPKYFQKTIREYYPYFVLYELFSVFIWNTLIIAFLFLEKGEPC